MLQNEIEIKKPFQWSTNRFMIVLCSGEPFCTLALPQRRRICCRGFRTPAIKQSPSLAAVEDDHGNLETEIFLDLIFDALQHWKKILIYMKCRAITQPGRETTAQAVETVTLELALPMRLLPLSPFRPLGLGSSPDGCGGCVGLSLDET